MTYVYLFCFNRIYLQQFKTQNISTKIIQFILPVKKTLKNFFGNILMQLCLYLLSFKMTYNDSIFLPKTLNVKLKHNLGENFTF